MQFGGHASRLWDEVCNIYKFQSARNGIKVISALLGGHLWFHSRIVQTSVLMWQVRDSTCSEQFEGFSPKTKRALSF